jgi:hypothetical protein
MKQTFTCPVELALDMLGGKWRTVILANIKEGAVRYADLRRCIPHMSEKMLTQRGVPLRIRRLPRMGYAAGRHQFAARCDRDRRRAHAPLGLG